MNARCYGKTWSSLLMMIQNKDKRCAIFIRSFENLIAQTKLLDKYDINYGIKYYRKQDYYILKNKR